MSDIPLSLDLREQIARIDRAQAEIQKFQVEVNKTIAEDRKLRAEEIKLKAEAGKLDRDRWWTPVTALIVALLSSIGSITAGALALYATLHASGH
jgi:hypothetical protein